MIVEALGPLAGAQLLDPQRERRLDRGGHRRGYRALLVDQVDRAQFGQLGQGGGSDHAQRLLGVERAVKAGGRRQQQLKPTPGGPHSFQRQVHNKRRQQSQHDPDTGRRHPAVRYRGVAQRCEEGQQPEGRRGRDTSPRLKRGRVADGEEVQQGEGAGRTARRGAQHHDDRDSPQIRHQRQVQARAVREYREHQRTRRQQSDDRHRRRAQGRVHFRQQERCRDQQRTGGVEPSGTRHRDTGFSAAQCASRLSVLATPHLALSRDQRRPTKTRRSAHNPSAPKPRDSGSFRTLRCRRGPSPWGWRRSRTVRGADRRLCAGRLQPARSSFPCGGGDGGGRSIR